MRANHRGGAGISLPPQYLGRGCASTFWFTSARINELADRPEFYNLLTNSCTINIIRYANAAGRDGRFDIRHLSTA